ncbi:MAG: hypothetical protein Q8Q08_08065 [Candidatus Omnitrophota bacterium]|nr:hypothetical protein [Candidatus Omnitrophota bacterium]MDZ4242007.1 hypothetical protein [Candidatus Omnitrophota bacterium]
MSESHDNPEMFKDGEPCRPNRTPEDMLGLFPSQGAGEYVQFLQDVQASLSSFLPAQKNSSPRFKNL